MTSTQTENFERRKPDRELFPADRQAQQLAGEIEELAAFKIETPATEEAATIELERAKAETELLNAHAQNIQRLLPKCRFETAEDLRKAEHRISRLQAVAKDATAKLLQLVKSWTAELQSADKELKAIAKLQDDALARGKQLAKNYEIEAAKLAKTLAGIAAVDEELASLHDREAKVRARPHVEVKKCRRVEAQWKVPGTHFSTTSVADPGSRAVSHSSPAPVLLPSTVVAKNAKGREVRVNHWPPVA